MQTLFISQDLWDVIENDYPVPESQEELATWTTTKQKEYKQNKQHDAKALLFIQQGVSREIFPRIMQAKNAKEAWETLKNEFKGTNKVISIKLQSLWKDFDTLIMREDESIQSFFSRVSNIFNQIRSYGDTIEDKKIILKILRSLPVKYDHIVAAIEESKDLSKLTLVELMGSLEAHEARMKRFEQPLEQAFQSKINISKNDGDKKNNHGKFPQKRGGTFTNHGKRSRKQWSNNASSSYCKLCKKNNHDTNDCRYKCKKCKRHLHYEKDCFYRQKEEANFL